MCLAVHNSSLGVGQEMGKDEKEETYIAGHLLLVHVDPKHSFL